MHNRFSLELPSLSRVVARHEFTVCVWNHLNVEPLWRLPYWMVLTCLADWESSEFSVSFLVSFRNLCVVGNKWLFLDRPLEVGLVPTTKEGKNERRGIN